MPASVSIPIFLSCAKTSSSLSFSSTLTSSGSGASSMLISAYFSSYVIADLGNTCFNTRSSSSISTGLLTKPSKPSARNICLAELIAFAVSATIGIEPFSPDTSVLILFIASTPSMPPIMWSMKMISKTFSRQISMDS